MNYVDNYESINLGHFVAKVVLSSSPTNSGNTKAHSVAIQCESESRVSEFSGPGRVEQSTVV